MKNTEVKRSRRDLVIGENLEGLPIILKTEVMPYDPVRKYGVWDYTVVVSTDEEETPAPAKKKRGRKARPSFTRIDMSTMEPVNGHPIVTFRKIGRL